MSSHNDSFSKDFEALLAEDSSLIDEYQTSEITDACCSSSLKSPNSKHSKRYSHFYFCEDHNINDDNKVQQWSISVNGKCENCIAFIKTDFLPPGKLPTHYEVLCFYLTKTEENQSFGDKQFTINQLANTIALHWIFCNVYPQSLTTIKTKLQTLKDHYHGLKKYPKNKRSKTYYSKLKQFIEKCGTLFDI